MNPARDMVARRRARTALVMALLALVTALGAYSVQAYAFAPDDAVTIAALQEQVELLTEQVADQEESIGALYENDAALDDRTIYAACLAYSDVHYVRERVNNSRKRWRLPLAVWNMSDPGCRSNPKKEWRPNRRSFATPLHLEVPNADR